MQCGDCTPPSGGMANVAHNVDNVNTPGYSRQIINQQAAAHCLWQMAAGILVWSSDVVSVDRVRDTFWMKNIGLRLNTLVKWEVKSNIIGKCGQFTTSQAEMDIQR